MVPKSFKILVQGPLVARGSCGRPSSSRLHGTKINNFKKSVTGKGNILGEQIMVTGKDSVGVLQWIWVGGKGYKKY